MMRSRNILVKWLPMLMAVGGISIRLLLGLILSRVLLRRVLLQLVLALEGRTTCVGGGRVAFKCRGFYKASTDIYGFSVWGFLCRRQEGEGEGEGRKLEFHY